MEKNNFFVLIGSILISLSAGFIGSSATTPNIPTWYAHLNKPFFNPPNWIFAPVWTTLYVMMGIAAYLIWKNGMEKEETRTALKIFAAQLVVNSLWSFVFFAWHQLFWSFVVIIILWLLVLLTILRFNKISKLAAWLLIPYLLWGTFATLLNFSIWVLN